MRHTARQFRLYVMNGYMVDSYRAHTGQWYVDVDVSNRPLSLREAKALLADLQREIERAERNDDDDCA